MEKWSNKPPQQKEGYGLRLIRTPKSGRIRALITCEELIGTPTHYWGGRTVPCQGSDCKVPHETIGWRWHGYVPMILEGDHEHVILELTAQACETIAQYAEANGSLRGVLLTATRATGVKNGRVLLKLEPTNLKTIVLPPEPDVPKVMRHIWGIQEETTVEKTYSPQRGNGFVVRQTEPPNGNVR